MPVAKRTVIFLHAVFINLSSSYYILKAWNSHSFSQVYFQAPKMVLLLVLSLCFVLLPDSPRVFAASLSPLAVVSFSLPGFLCTPCLLPISSPPPARPNSCSSAHQTHTAAFTFQLFMHWSSATRSCFFWTLFSPSLSFSFGPLYVLKSFLFSFLLLLVPN